MFKFLLFVGLNIMFLSLNELTKIEEKVVLIYNKKSSCIGHGALIDSNGLILTASHLFDESTVIGYRVNVRVNGGRATQMYVARVVKLEWKWDIALLQIEVPNKLKYAKFAKKVRVGQDLHMVVSSDGDILSYTSGTVAFERRPFGDIVHSKNIDYFDPETIFVQAHNLHGQPGCSGAPIFSSKGRIVGMYSSAYLKSDLLVHVEHLKTLSYSFIQVCPAS